MRWLALTAGSVLFAATPALADVDVYAKYDKKKDIRIHEDIDIHKHIDIHTAIDSKPKRAAEAEGLINQKNYENRACENCAEKRDRIIDSLNGNNGVIDVNQAAGNMNNQGNAVAISIDNETPDTPKTPEGRKDGDSYADAQAAVDQKTFRNRADATNLLEKSALLRNSLNNNRGVIEVNQAPGNMNSQANSLALAVGFGDGGVALAEAALGQVNARNYVYESGEKGNDTGIHKFATIDSSINSNSGIVGVNQAAGNMANQANVVSFAVITGGASGTP